MSRAALLCLVLAATVLLGAGSAAAQPGEGGGPRFRVAPYLLDVTREAATVGFHLSEPLTAEVRLAGDDGGRRFASPGPATAHFIRVTGLAPGRTYPYEVICGGGALRTPAGDPSQRISTAVLPGESFTFVAYGDPRPGENQTTRHHQLVVGQMLRVEPAFSLVLGDLVDDGSSAAELEEFFQVESELRRRSAIFPVMGDNDYAGGKSRWADYFPSTGPDRYRFEWGGVYFFAMNAWGTRTDQPERELDARSEQLGWLAAELGRPEVAEAPFRVVFLHDPVLISRGRSADVLRRAWAPLLSERGVDLVLASWHLYERSRHDEVTYLISGGGGAELVWSAPDPAYPSQAEARLHHFVRVDVNAEAMQIRAIAEDGTVIDSLTLLPRAARAAEHAEAIGRLARRLGRELDFGPAEGERLDAYVFSYDCAYCRRLLGHELPAWARAQSIALRVHYFDLGLPGAYDLLMAAGADFGRQDADIPSVLLGRVVLGGEAEISAGVPAELARFRADPEGYRRQAFVPFGRAHDTQAMRTKRFEALTAAIVLAAGLADGVNPCAFTTIIFLLSYLGVAGGPRRQILVTGGLFTLGVFLTYLGIGAAFYQLAHALMGNRALALGVNVVLLAALAVLAALSAVDAVRALRGRPTDLTLKLPAGLQARIRDRIRRFARNDLAVGTAAFTLGGVVAAMELACTGQVYVPIVTMIAEPKHRPLASLYLFAYNLAFILPLVLVFALVVFGLTSQRLARVARRHVATAKLALAALFVGLGLVVLHNLGWLGS
jgi:cytochrome c biogenesis protein CcdA